MNMVAHHISVGPEAGSSVGKNIFNFLPTLIGIIQTILFHLSSENLKKNKPYEKEKNHYSISEKKFDPKKFYLSLF